MVPWKAAMRISSPCQGRSSGSPLLWIESKLARLAKCLAFRAIAAWRHYRTICRYTATTKDFLTVEAREGFSHTDPSLHSGWHLRGFYGTVNIQYSMCNAQWSWWHIAFKRNRRAAPPSWKLRVVSWAFNSDSIIVNWSILDNCNDYCQSVPELVSVHK